MQNPIKASYERITPYFYWFSRMIEGRARTESVKISGIKEDSSVLIIAPPTEFYLNKLLELNPNGRNNLLYFSKEMEQIAQDRINKGEKNNYTLDICSVQKLPYIDNEFNHILAYCYFDFLNIEGIRIACSEIKRILKPRGNLSATYLSYPVNLLEKVCVYSISKLSFLRGLRVVEVKHYLIQNNFKNVSMVHYRQKGIPVDLIYAETEEC